jgi:hypothetical protein
MAIIECVGDSVFYDEETRLKLSPGMKVEVDPSLLGQRTRKWVRLGKLALSLAGAVAAEEDKDVSSKKRKANAD